MTFFSRSNPGRSGAGSQHLIQPQSTYKQFKISVPRLFRRSRGHDTAIEAQLSAVDITEAVPVGHEEHVSVDIPNDIPQATPTPHHDSTNPKIKGCNTSSNTSAAELVTVPVTTQFQDAHGVSISGNPQFTNIGVNHSINFYGGTHGLENLKDFVSFAALHDSAEQDPTRRCHPGTRTTVLSQLRDWFDNPNPTDRICWLHGPAGAGKSAIAQTIAHEYKKRGAAATFFFYRSDAERSDGNRLFPTLAWQLAFSIPAIKHFIAHALDNTPHLPRKDIETQFEQLVAYPFDPTNNIASQLPQSAPVVIIDGVDECSDEQLQRRILSVIGNAIKDCLVPLHFLICSRSEALIEEVLDQFKDFTLRIDLAKLDDSNRDIEKYLVDQFSDIRSKNGLAPTWPGTDTIEEFVFKSSGNFIFAATVMRCISDEDCDPEEQLDIVRNLKPRGRMSPFALLDELYLEILKRPRDQDFLKTFLALLLGRSSIKSGLHKDDGTLMNVSEKNLHVKLRRMRSLLQFEPFIDVYHKSFLDFLEDSSRSGEYHVSKQRGQKRYLELIVGCVVRHVSMAIEQPNRHERCSRPKFRSIIKEYPPKIVLHVEDWQEALKPLLYLHDRLLRTLKPQPCYFSWVMRELLLHLAVLQGNHHIAPVQLLESNVNQTVMEHSPTEAGQIRLENDLDRRLSVLLSCLQQKNSVLAVDTAIIDHMSSLLVFDCAEIVARVRSVMDAQKLIDLIGLLSNNESFLIKCGWNAAHNATLLASETFARVPLLPRSVCLNGPTQHCDGLLKSLSASIEYLFQSVFISRILDHNYILPVLGIYQRDILEFSYGDVNESVDQWLKRSSPNLVSKIRVMVEIAKTIRYIHSLDFVIALNSEVIQPESFALDWHLRAKVMFRGYFAWQVREYLIYDQEESGRLASFTPKANIAAFANLFRQMCFGGNNENDSNHLVEDASQLIERCQAEDPKSQPSMEDVVKEMETWNLT